MSHSTHYRSFQGQAVITVSPSIVCQMNEDRRLACRLKQDHLEVIGAKLLTESITIEQLSSHNRYV